MRNAKLKACEILEDKHKAQAINYLEAYNIADGLLNNFGGMSLEFKRVYNKRLFKPTGKPLNKPSPKIFDLHHQILSVVPICIILSGQMNKFRWSIVKLILCLIILLDIP
jgi:hypothetical protein